MPKAAINEDRESLRRKHDIWTAPDAWEWSQVLAEAQATTVQR